MNLDHIHWLGHASFRIEDHGKQIYIDPWKIKMPQPAADLILITHAHYDHHSPEDIARIMKNGTLIVGPPDVMVFHKNQGFTITPGISKTIAGLTIETVPAYNLSQAFHPKSNGWVGYILMLSSGQRIYHTGDTDFTPEMKLVTTDIILVPIGGTYTMGPEAAAEACAAIQPQVAIPMHWGDIVGSKREMEKFTQQSTIPVVVKKTSDLQ
jgi:L-ascorbate metabolism protein UlaG (beta-lactamase superfamily)